MLFLRVKFTFSRTHPFYHFYICSLINFSSTSLSIFFDPNFEKSTKASNFRSKSFIKFLPASFIEFFPTSERQPFTWKNTKVDHFIFLKKSYEPIYPVNE